MSENQKVQLPEDVLALGETLLSGIKDGQFTNANAYADHLTSLNLSVEDAEKYQDANNTYIAAAALATGQHAIPAMTADKTLQSVNLTFPMAGKDTVQTTFVRERSGTIGEEKKPYTTYGNISAKVNVHATGNRGAMAMVKNFCRVNATEAYGSK